MPPPYGTATVGAVTVTLMARQVDSPIYEFRADVQVDSMVSAVLPSSTRDDMILAFTAAIVDYERKLRGAG